MLEEIFNCAERTRTIDPYAFFRHLLSLSECAFFSIVCLLFVVCMSSQKVGMSCMALPVEVEVRLRRNEWFLLISTVGLFVEGDAEGSLWPFPFL